MAFLSPADTQAIQKIFTDRLGDPVTLHYFTHKPSPIVIPGQESDYLQETQGLLTEVVGLSDKLRLVVSDIQDDPATGQSYGIDHVPAFQIEGKAAGKVRYFGIPSGYEFNSLIEDIVAVSRGEYKLGAPLSEFLAGLQSELHIQVFGTPT